MIRSAHNDRLRLARKLHERKGRRKEERFLLEGPKVIREVLATEPGLLEQVLYRADEGLGDEARSALAAARAAGIPCYPVDPALYDAAAPSDRPQPLLGLARIRWSGLGALLGAAEPRARAAVGCLGVQDPGNLGTILRTSRFLGFAGAVVLPGTHDPYSPKVVRSSAGALLEQPPAQAASEEELMGAADEAALTPVALVAHGGMALAACELPHRALFLLGSEGQGLGDEVSKRAGLRVSIPSPRPTAESLNVAVAFGIVAQAWCAQWVGR